MPYQNSIFLNIPVANLEASINFYNAIGFVQNKTFSSGDSAMMSLPPVGVQTGPQAHEGPIKIMLLNHSSYRSFLPPNIDIADPKNVAQCLICLSRPSNEAVDELCDKAAEAGGKKDIREKSELEKQMEQSGMYGRV